MADLSGFDANQVEPASRFDPLPAGSYVAVVTESEMKPTKSGQGEYLQLTFQIVEGEHRGRILWDRLNLVNPTKAAVKIAQATLSAICRAVAVPRPNESADLHNLPLVIQVRCKKRSDTGEIGNEIAGYAPHPSPAERAVAATNGVAANTTPPWARPAQGGAA